MGHIVVRAKLKNPENKKAIALQAPVDTGATDTVVPEQVAHRLNLKTLSKSKVLTAKGYLTVKRSYCLVEIKGRKSVVPVSITSRIRKILIGVTTLETLGLKVDPVKEKLIKGEVLLL